MKKTTLAIAFILFSTLHTFAQNTRVEMADGLRSSGKIWVVVLVLLTIFAGIFVYLFTIDRRIKKLEKDK